MTRSKTAIELITTVRQALRDRDAFQQNLQQKVMRYATRTHKIGAAFRQKIITTALAASGVDIAAIKKRQEANDASDRNFIDSLSAGIKHNAARVSSRHKTLGRAFLKGRMPTKRPSRPGPHSPSTLVDILTTADDISFDSFAPTPSVTSSSSIAAWNNVARVRIIGNLAFHPFSAYISFLWTPPRAGILGVLVPVSVNGSNLYASQHQCIQATANQTGDVFVTIFQQGATPDPLDCDTQRFLDVQWSDWPGCSTDLENNVIDKFLVLQHNTGLSVAAGVPLVIMVVLQLDVVMDEAIGEIDLKTGAKGITVPGLIINLQ